MTRGASLQQAHDAADELRALPHVLGVDVLPNCDRYDGHPHVLEATADVPRVTPRILKILHDHDLGVESVDRQAEYRILIAR